MNIVRPRTRPCRWCGKSTANVESRTCLDCTKRRRLIASDTAVSRAMLADCLAARCGGAMVLTMEYEPIWWGRDKRTHMLKTAIERGEGRHTVRVSETKRTPLTIAVSDSVSDYCDA